MFIEIHRVVVGHYRLLQCEWYHVPQIVHTFSGITTAQMITFGKALAFSNAVTIGCLCLLFVGLFVNHLEPKIDAQLTKSNTFRELKGNPLEDYLRGSR